MRKEEGKNMIKVSVIIPIYNVSRFIERCAESLMQQTLNEVEFIFINDATPDDSIAILEKVITAHPERNETVRIVHHDSNKGLPAARNTGMAHAQGKYIFHCDSDDFMETDMLEQLYNKAEESDADIVWCDWFLSFEKNERYMKQPTFDTPVKALKAMLSGAMKYNVWNKLVKRSLYVDNNISFPAGYGMGEDMTMMLLFAHAKSVAYVPRAFYHYVKLNTGAFSQTYSDRHLLELKHNVEHTAEYLQTTVGSAIEKELAFFKLESKFPFLISEKRSKYRLWSEWYPEANKYIFENRNISARSRWLQWAASKSQWWIVWLHYQLIIRVVYGIIYR